MSKKYTVIVGICIFSALAVITVMTLMFGSNELPSVVQTESERQNDEPFCVLVLGQDKVSGLTDVMMLASLDVEKQRISVLQLPRDTYVDYGSSYCKLNGALKYFGSEEKLCEFLSESFGVRIDGYVSLGLPAFRNAIDAVGGVEFELERAIRYSDPEQNLYIDLPAGKQVLDGKTAEMLVRFRSGYVRGDLDRLDVQKRFLVALFNKFKSSVDLSNAYELAANVLGGMRTDIDIPLAVALGIKALSVDTSAIAFITLPGEDVVSQKSGGSYYVMSAEPTQNALKEFFSFERDTVDENQLFMNARDKDFCEIYFKKFDYFVSFADSMD